MSKILCAVDFSLASERAADAASRLARAFDLPLELVHVIELPPGLRGEGALSAAATIRRGAEDRLEREVTRLKEKGGAVSGWVESGYADEAILATVNATQPALLVLGSHGRGPVTRLLVGSVAERCLQQVARPVLVVPPGGVESLTHPAPDQPLRVTAGIDFSTASDATVAWLRWMATRTAVELTIVHLFWPPRESRRLGLSIGSAEELARGEIVAILTRELRDRVGDLPVPARLRVLPSWGDDPSPLALEAEAGGADLLVLGTSLGGGASTAIGAVRAGRLPVLCVPALIDRSCRAAGWGARHKMLAVTDLSAAGEAAVDEAAWILRGKGELTICHVIGPEPDSATRARVAVALRSLASRTERRFGMKVTTLVHESASVPEGIVQAIRRVGPDMVVVGSGPGRAHGVLGSTAEQVMRQSPVPVVIVPAGGAR